MCDGHEAMGVIGFMSPCRSIMWAWKLPMGPLLTSVERFKARGNQPNACLYGELASDKSSTKVENPQKEEG